MKSPIIRKSIRGHYKYYNTRTKKYLTSSQYQYNLQQRNKRLESRAKENYYQKQIEKIYEKSYEEATKKWGLKKHNFFRKQIIDARPHFKKTKSGKWRSLHTKKVYSRDTMKKIFKSIRKERMTEEIMYKKKLPKKSARKLLSQLLKTQGWSKTVNRLLFHSP